jgi:hypothetical protein
MVSGPRRLTALQLVEDMHLRPASDGGFVWLFKNSNPFALGFLHPLSLIPSGETVRKLEHSKNLTENDERSPENLCQEEAYWQNFIVFVFAGTKSRQTFPPNIHAKKSPLNQGHILSPASEKKLPSTDLGEEA